MSTDILLTHGYFLDLDPVEQNINKPYPPLGLLSLSAYLKQVGISVDVFDSTFSTAQQFRAHVRASTPAIVGFYVNMMTRGNVLSMVAFCKELGITTILGGPEPVNYPAEYLHGGADIIVQGEGELTLGELIPHVKRHGLNRLEDVDGIIFGNGHLVTNPAREKIKQLDSLPFPDRDSIDLYRYMSHWKHNHGASSVSLITARGCPYTCRWCSHSVYGFSYRSRSPENVADEVEHIKTQFDPDQLWYADDVFTINKKWLARYADELEQRDLHLPFETITREDRLDLATIKVLQRMGCYRLWIGAESGSQRVLDAMDRRTDVVRMREMIQLLKDHGIRVGTFIMFGYDGETWDDLTQTRDHLVTSLPDDVLTTVAYPIKGTPYFEAVSDRVIATTSWQESSDRDYQVRDQKSKVFYWFTRHWIDGGVRYHREMKTTRPAIARVFRAIVAATMGRVGMYLCWSLPGPGTKPQH